MIKDNVSLLIRLLFLDNLKVFFNCRCFKGLSCHYWLNFILLSTVIWCSYHWTIIDKHESSEVLWKLDIYFLYRSRMISKERGSSNNHKFLYSKKFSFRQHCKNNQFYAPLFLFWIFFRNCSWVILFLYVCNR